MKRTIAALALTGAATLTLGIGTGHADTVENNTSAQQSFAAQLGVATAVGGTGGAIVGAGIGCAAGVLASGVTVFIAALPFCGAGAVTGAGIGGVVGTIAVGGPTLLVGGAALANTLLTPAA